MDDWQANYIEIVKKINFHLINKYENLKYMASQISILCCNKVNFCVVKNENDIKATIGNFGSRQDLTKNFNTLIT